MDEIEFQLLKRIAQGESQVLDFKFAVNDSRKIARSMSAFSNTDGGSLLIGVKDNGSLAGIRSEEEIYMAESAATIHCKPEVSFKSVLYEIQSKEILEIIIPARPKVLTLAPAENGTDIAWLRFRDSNHPAGIVYERVWKRRKSEYGVKISIAEQHKILLDIFVAKGQLSLAQLIEETGFTSRLTRKTLEQLILVNLADFCLTENGMRYCLRGE
ncbi:MAG: ATP-binding protein [Bacteroidetes bacterium HGW-Bacteroidetes-6]|jgi:predicted HTH transcriptional regulator|nr:MAG: ATP-binding protein [Bacteroidetes bacterium HGW-Bacteroidetes-6]